MFIVCPRGCPYTLRTRRNGTARAARARSTAPGRTIGRAARKKRDAYWCAGAAAPAVANWAAMRALLLLALARANEPSITAITPKSDGEVTLQDGALVMAYQVANATDDLRLCTQLTNKRVSFESPHALRGRAGAGHVL